MGCVIALVGSCEDYT